ncbi:ABC transporter permease [Acetobacter conturbans]|uniref:ABC transporter permease n=1 Tax=Acetobacter conturbans TaxID=1737472 RepID=A0ABX0JY16_9PROT|nr:ABC transporter permease [Acetobacter conturbans]NHN87456.1 ABC transporter permease [Acetobacter conturbans]
MTPALITPVDLLIAAAVILACAVISRVLALNAGRAIVIAALRMTVQLLLIGNVLLFVFGQTSILLTFAVLVVILCAATFEAGNRQTTRMARRWHFSIAGFSILCGAALATSTGFFTSLCPHPLFAARATIPMAGLIIGNVMNATSLTLNSLLSSVTRERGAIEARISLGATRLKALEDPILKALRTALIPTLNQMSAAGLVTLPGIMTGQLLAGMSPVSASRYQIVLMSLVIFGNLAGATIAATLTTLHLTDHRGRLRLDRLRP